MAQMTLWAQRAKDGALPPKSFDHFWTDERNTALRADYAPPSDAKPTYLVLDAICEHCGVVNDHLSANCPFGLHA